MIVHSQNHHFCTEKMQRCEDYVEALEEERRKIQVFQRELPLCLELVTQAIETCKQQVSGASAEDVRGQSECSEQTSSEGPVIEEFIPIKRTSSSDDGEEQAHEPVNSMELEKIDVKSSNKLDWLQSAQLWNQTPDQPSKEDTPRKVPVAEVKRDGGGAFRPFKREKSNAITSTTTMKSESPSSVVSSTVEPRGYGGGSSKEDKEGQCRRKARRCWSTELHRRFLNALQQLGGSHVATPKQIRELMKVDGLTNDEVKSHLQKYRLHTRKPASSAQNTTSPVPQYVVVGGIWVPPPDYAALAATAASGEASGVTTSTTHGIYAPVAAPPPPLPEPLVHQTPRRQNKESQQLLDESQDGVSSNSPATSSTTMTCISMASPSS